MLNEVAAVTRRLIEGLFAPTIVGANIITKVFESKSSIERTRSKLRAGTDVHLAIGYETIRRYLGQGNAERSLRGERQIREAGGRRWSALQSRGGGRG